MNPRPIFSAALALKRHWTDDETAVLTLADVRKLDDAIQEATGGHHTPSGSPRWPLGRLSLRHGAENKPEGEE
jgi:hypothetical protein